MALEWRDSFGEGVQVASSPKHGTYVVVPYGPVWLARLDTWTTIWAAGTRFEDPEAAKLACQNHLEKELDK